jgi:HlyD family secretion protein
MPEANKGLMTARLWALRWRIATGAAALAALTYVGVLAILGPRVEVAQVVRRDVVQSVVASGRVATPYRVDIGSQIVGTVVKVPVEQGQTVKAGQTLILLEASEARAGVKQAEVAVAQAEARLRQLRELQLPVAGQNLRQAEVNFTNAQAQYDRNKRLYEEGFVGKSVLDDAQRNVDVARTQVESARKQLETAQPTGSDYAMALTALEQARAGLQSAQAKLAYTTISAPWDGTLIAREVERGDVVQPGKVLMVLSPAGETQIVLQIDERNLSRLKLGQSALASADAYPAQRFPATLCYINPGVDAQRGTVEVKLCVPNPPDYVRQDMTVSADIEVERHANVLSLRADALHDATGPAPWVLVVRQGAAHRQPVKLGLRGEGSVEVLDGLAEGDLVVPTSVSRIKAGSRLRAAPNA